MTGSPERVEGYDTSGYGGAKPRDLYSFLKEKPVKEKLVKGPKKKKLKELLRNFLDGKLTDGDDKTYLFDAIYNAYRENREGVRKAIELISPKEKQVQILNEIKGRMLVDLHDHKNPIPEEDRQDMLPFIEEKKRGGWSDKDSAVKKAGETFFVKNALKGRLDVKSDIAHEIKDILFAFIRPLYLNEKIFLFRYILEKLYDNTIWGKLGDNEKDFLSKNFPSVSNYFKNEDARKSLKNSIEEKTSIRGAQGMSGGGVVSSAPSEMYRLKHTSVKEDVDQNIVNRFLKNIYKLNEEEKRILFDMISHKIGKEPLSREEKEFFSFVFNTSPLSIPEDRDDLVKDFLNKRDLFYNQMLTDFEIGVAHEALFMISYILEKGIENLSKKEKEVLLSIAPNLEGIDSGYFVTHGRSENIHKRLFSRKDALNEMEKTLLGQSLLERHADGATLSKAESDITVEAFVDECGVVPWKINKTYKSHLLEIVDGKLNILISQMSKYKVSSRGLLKDTKLTSYAQDIIDAKNIKPEELDEFEEKRRQYIRENIEDNPLSKNLFDFKKREICENIAAGKEILHKDKKILAILVSYQTYKMLIEPKEKSGIIKACPRKNIIEDLPLDVIERVNLSKSVRDYTPILRNVLYEKYFAKEKVGLSEDEESRFKNVYGEQIARIIINGAQNKRDVELLRGKVPNKVVKLIDINRRVHEIGTKAIAKRDDTLKLETCPEKKDYENEKEYYYKLGLYLLSKGNFEDRRLSESSRISYDKNMGAFVAFKKAGDYKFRDGISGNEMFENAKQIEALKKKAREIMIYGGEFDDALEKVDRAIELSGEVYNESLAKFRAEIISRIKKQNKSNENEIYSSLEKKILFNITLDENIQSASKTLQKVEERVKAYLRANPYQGGTAERRKKIKCAAQYDEWKDVLTKKISELIGRKKELVQMEKRLREKLDYLSNSDVGALRLTYDRLAKIEEEEAKLEDVYEKIHRQLSMMVEKDDRLIIKNWKDQINRALQLVGGGDVFKGLTLSNLELLKEYADCGYSISEVVKDFKRTFLNVARTGDIKGVLIRFLRWAQSNPDRVVNATGNIMILYNILKDGSGLEGIRKSFHNQIITQQILGRPVVKAEQSDKKEEAMYLFLCNFLAAAPVTIDAVKALLEGKGAIKTAADLLKVAAMQYVASKTSVDTKRLAMAVFEFYKTGSYSKVRDMQAKYEGYKIVGEILRAFTEKNYFKYLAHRIKWSVKSWWLKIKRSKSGLERFLRITLQIVLPVTGIAIGVGAGAVAITGAAAGIALATAPTLGIALATASAAIFGGIIVAAGIFFTTYLIYRAGYKGIDKVYSKTVEEVKKLETEEIFSDKILLEGDVERSFMEKVETESEKYIGELERKIELGIDSDERSSEKIFEAWREFSKETFKNDKAKERELQKINERRDTLSDEESIEEIKKMLKARFEGILKECFFDAYVKGKDPKELEREAKEEKKKLENVHMKYIYDKKDKDSKELKDDNFWNEDIAKNLFKAAEEQNY